MTKFEFEIKRQRWETLDTAVARLSKWVPICFIVYFVFRSIAALAGKVTLAEFGVWAIADLKSTKIFSHTVHSYIWARRYDLWIPGAQIKTKEHPTHELPTGRIRN